MRFLLQQGPHSAVLGLRLAAPIVVTVGHGDVVCGDLSDFSRRYRGVLGDEVAYLRDDVVDDRINRLRGEVDRFGKRWESAVIAHEGIEV